MPSVTYRLASIGLGFTGTNCARNVSVYRMVRCKQAPYTHFLVLYFLSGSIGIALMVRTRWSPIATEAQKIERCVIGV